MIKLKDSAKNGEYLLPGKIVKVENFRNICFPKSSLKNNELKRKLIELTSNGEVTYLNSLGYKYNTDGSLVRKENAAYYLYEMADFKTKDGEPLYGWFYLENKYRGFQWGRYVDFQKAIVNDNQCSIGQLIFDSYKDRYYFLQKIQKATLPDGEKLDSCAWERYIKLFIEDRLIESESLSAGKFIIIQTDLKTQKKEPVIIVGDIKRVGKCIEIHHPKIELGKSEKRKYNSRRIQKMKLKLNNN